MPSFVADEHISSTTIDLLRKAGYSVISIREECPGATDFEILTLADQSSCVVITNDGDFGELIFKDKVQFSAGLIFFRFVSFRSDEMAEMILHRIEEYGDEFEGLYTTISRERFRQRPIAT